MTESALSLKSLPPPVESLKNYSFLYTFELFFHAGNRLLIAIEKWALISGFFLMMFLVLYPMAHRWDFLSRFFSFLAGHEEGVRKTLFEKSDWAIELSRYVLLWVAMCGGALATAHHRHITIDLITKFISLRVKALFSLISASISLLFCFWLTITSVSYVYQDMLAEIKTTTMQIPLWWIKIIFPFGFLVFVYHYFVSMLEDIRGLATGNYHYLLMFEADASFSEVPPVPPENKPHTA